MHTRKKGFTIIELMIAIAIVGILTTIALPAYQNSIRKSKRQVAISDMLLYKQAEEKYRSHNLTYGTLLQISVAPYAFKQSSLNADYIFTITNNTATTYTINAEAQGSQKLGGEATCVLLSITEADIRGPSSECWAK